MFFVKYKKRVQFYRTKKSKKEKISSVKKKKSVV